MAKIGNINLGDFPLLPAPMEDVSDPPFRAAYEDKGAYLEFISSEGLFRDAIESSQQPKPATAGAEAVTTGRVATGYSRKGNEIRHFIRTGEHLPPITVLERVRVCKKHLHHPIARKGKVVGTLETRRHHYTNYLKGLPHINDLKQQSVTCKTQAVTEEVSEAIAAK